MIYDVLVGVSPKPYLLYEEQIGTVKEQHKGTAQGTAHSAIQRAAKILFAQHLF